MLGIWNNSKNGAKPLKITKYSVLYTVLPLKLCWYFNDWHRYRITELKKCRAMKPTPLKNINWTSTLMPSHKRNQLPVMFIHNKIKTHILLIKIAVRLPKQYKIYIYFYHCAFIINWQQNIKFTNHSFYHRTTFINCSPLSNSLHTPIQVNSINQISGVPPTWIPHYAIMVSVIFIVWSRKYDDCPVGCCRVWSVHEISIILGHDSVPAEESHNGLL